MFNRRNRRLNELDNKWRNARDGLVREQIRGELISWRNELGYLARLKDRRPQADNADYALAARDCFLLLTKDYSELPGVYPELVVGMEMVRAQVEAFINAQYSGFALDPVDTLMWMARNGCLLETIGYIEQLIDEYSMGNPWMV